MSKTNDLINEVFLLLRTDGSETRFADIIIELCEFPKDEITVFAIAGLLPLSGFANVKFLKEYNRRAAPILAKRLAEVVPGTFVAGDIAAREWYKEHEEFAKWQEYCRSRMAPMGA